MDAAVFSFLASALLGAMLIFTRRHHSRYTLDALSVFRRKELIGEGGVISIQVLNEFASAASRKLRMSIPEIRQCLEPIAKICRIEPLTLETHARGLDVAERYGFSVVDSISNPFPVI